MSWQQYVDQQLLATKMVSQAVICGHDGSIWAKSEGFAPTADELKTLLANYGAVDALSMNGIKLAGTKYMYLSSSDKVVRAKKGTSGIHTIKTNKALIACLYEDPIVPEQAAMVTEKLGDYLISVGF